LKCDWKNRPGNPLERDKQGEQATPKVGARALAAFELVLIVQFSNDWRFVAVV
jgi:hypothetical protein